MFLLGSLRLAHRLPCSSLARYWVKRLASFAGSSAPSCFPWLLFFVGLIPEAIQPCTATGPSCTDDNQVVFGIPIPLMALVAFTMIGVLAAISLKEKQT